MMPLDFLASREKRCQGPFHQTEKLPNFLAMPLGKLPAVREMVLKQNIPEPRMVARELDITLGEGTRCRIGVAI